MWEAGVGWWSGGRAGLRAGLSRQQSPEAEASGQEMSSAPQARGPRTGLQATQRAQPSLAGGCMRAQVLPTA